jgi:Ca-activated chloride channel family protein
MTGLILLRPFWLLALAPVAALALWLWRRRAAGEWASVIDAPLLAAMRRLGHLHAAGIERAPFAACACAGLAALALAGPAVQREGAASFERRDPIVLLLDLSPSVAAGPALADLPVGIMLYAADGYVASAPTTDAASLEGLVAVLSPEVMPVAGSRPDIALAEARDLFAGPGAPGTAGADLIVISDGGGADRALDEAARLASEGARVWTLALAPRAEGAPPPDPRALEDLARLGGGASAPARDPKPILARIEAARIARIAASAEQTLVFRDLGPWLLLAAAFPALSLFRRRL